MSAQGLDSALAGSLMHHELDADTLFAGSGEMRALCRELDWARTPLGPVGGWSPSLRTTAGLLLASRNPMFLWWGAELVQIYNDAYRPSLGQGDRHPRALGAKGREFWTDIWSAIGPQIEQVMTKGESTWHENQYLPIERNGHLEDVWWTYSYSPVYEVSGAIGGTLVVCMETTQRVQSELQNERLLREAESARARLGELFRQAPAFMAVLRGPEHVIEMANDDYDQLIGYREILGKPVVDALPEVRGQGFVDLLDNVLETGRPFVGRELSLRVARTPGALPEERFVTFVYQPITEADGTRSGVFVLGTDVTEQVVARRDIERLLAESERARADAESAREHTSALQALTAALSTASTVEQIAAAIVDHATTLLGAAGVVVARLSDDGQFLELVRANHMPSDVGKAWHRFSVDVPSPLADAVRTRTPLYIESRADWAARYPDLVPLLDATGHHANVVTPLIVDDRVLGALGVAFDAPRTFSEEDRAATLTLARQCAQALERARLFEAERVARVDAEAANRAKSEFLAVMSHELRTPLNAIDGYAELMELGIRGAVTEEQRADLARIRKSQRHLLGLINGVLNYARVEAGAVRYDVADVPVDEVLATCEALVAPQVRGKRLTLEYAECDRSIVVRADSEKLQQIVLNLLTNSIKFTEPGGRISLSCRGRGKEVEISITDTGRGITAAHLTRVFEPFVQVDAQLTRTQEGVGLGLAISRDLARGMGGDLTAESTPGIGSTFTLTLPSP